MVEATRSRRRPQRGTMARLAAMLTTAAVMRMADTMAEVVVDTMEVEVVE